MNSYNETTELTSFLPRNLNSNKETLIINNEVLSPQTHELTLGCEPLNKFTTEYLESLCFLHFFWTPTVTQQILFYYLISKNETETSD